MKEYKPTKEEIYGTERYTIVEIPYNTQFILPAKEATILVEQVQKAEAIKDNYYNDQLLLEIEQAISIKTTTVSKAVYHQSKVTALLLANTKTEDTNETD